KLCHDDRPALSPTATCCEGGLESCDSSGAIQPLLLAGGKSNRAAQTVLLTPVSTTAWPPPTSNPRHLPPAKERGPPFVGAGLVLGLRHVMRCSADRSCDGHVETGSVHQLPRVGGVSTPRPAPAIACELPTLGYILNLHVFS
ncbi:hypothetical protein JHW43_006830, partial [Diplocarpon mali]